MALSTGTRIGPYKITGVLGAGGMGEVYRARDARLGRDVALKVLPELLARDPERVARFAREAQVLASLSHPNIAVIHHVEDATDGAGAFVKALVLELVEGETLADRIARGPIPADEALAIAKQIADALEAAHDHGVIHRDLKPSNIKVTPDGVIKVLDFGLAKLHTLDAPSGSTPSAGSISPTVTSPAMMTGIGVILGTAAYMSPEQARGREADKRSDVWAFGCVLYEMLTGRRAFHGEDMADTVAAILRSEPDWSVLPANLPRPIGAILRRCLDKDKRKRIGDVAAALAVMDDAVAVAGMDSLAAVRVRSASSWKGIGTVAGVVILVAAASATAAWMMMRPRAQRVSRLTLAPAVAHPLAVTGEGRNVAISRDGNRIAYAGSNGTLLVRSLDQLEPTVLVSNDGVVAPFFSPDGQWIGYFPANRDLRKVPAAGGPTAVLSVSDNARSGGATWADDGTIVFATSNRSSGLQLVAAGVTSPRNLTTPDRARGEADHLWPEFLPDGRSVLFTITSNTSAADNTQIAVVDVRTGMSKIVMPGGSHAHYVTTGHLVYAAAGGLRAVRFDIDRLEIAGASVPVVSPVMTTADGAGDFDIASDGTLVYVSGGGAAQPQRELVWVGRDGKVEPLRTPLRMYLYPRISPDGTRLLLDIRDQESDIWLWDFRRETLTNLTRNPGLDRFPLWTSDGRQFIFISDREGGLSAVYRQAADGSGEAERMSNGSKEQQTPNAMTADGKKLIFDLGNDALMLLELDGSRRASPLLLTDSVESRASLSPNDSWLAYHSDESGHSEIYVRPFPMVNAGREQVSTAGGIQPWWSRTGNELFYVAPTGAIMSVRVGSGKNWSASPPAVAVSNVSLHNATNPTSAPVFDLSADGSRFLVVREAKDAKAVTSAPTLVVVQNWFEELKRLVP